MFAWLVSRRSQQTSNGGLNSSYRNWLTLAAVALFTGMAFSTAPARANTVELACPGAIADLPLCENPGCTSAGFSSNPTDNVTVTGVLPGSELTLTFANTNDVDVSIEFQTNAGDNGLPAPNPLTVPSAGAGGTAVATHSVSVPDATNDGNFHFKVNLASPSGAPVSYELVCSDPPTNPSMTLAKTASPDVLTGPGTINYSFLVTNTGDIPLTAVTVSDLMPGLSPIACPSATLAVGANMNCTATLEVDQAAIDAGTPIVNTATADSAETNPVVDVETVTITRTPGMTLAKTANPTSLSAPGTVNYSFLVTNTGNTTLTSVSVADPLSGLSAVNCPSDTIPVGGDMTCTASLSVDQSAIDSGNSIINTATASSAETAPAQGGATVTIEQTSGMTLAKTADPTTLSGPDTVTYSFLLTNTGNTTLTGVGVTDPLPGLSAISCPATSIDVGANMTCTATLDVTQQMIDAGTAIVNTATANSDQTEPVDDGATTTINQTPAMTFAKSAEPTSLSAPGTVTYSFLLTNTGNTTLIDVAVTDPLPGLSAIACPGTTIDVGADMTCTATLDVTQQMIDAGTAIVNTASAASAVTAPVEDGATVTIDQTPGMTLAKTAEPTSLSAPGTVTYSFLLTNTGNTTLIDVAVTDPLPGLSAVSCPDTNIDVGANKTCTATLNVTQEMIDAGTPIVNTATASSAVTEPVNDDATVTINQTPSMTLAKTADPTELNAPATVNYTFVITNTGNTTLNSVAITDPLPGLSAVSCPGDTIAVGGDMTCTASLAVDQAAIDAGTPIINTATATASGAAPAEDEATVVIGQTPLLSLAKTADPTQMSAPGTVTYSFLITNTGNVSLTGVGVTDPLPGLSAISCPGTTIDVGAEMTCTATLDVTQEMIDAGTPIVNNATADSDQSEPDGDDATVTISTQPGMSLAKTADPTSLSAPGTVNYSFLVTNTGNTTLTGVSVSDPLPGLSAVSCPSNTLAVGADMTCTASLAVDQAAIDAGTAIVNTASAIATGFEPVVDDATVTITRSSSLTFAKTADPTSLSAPGTVNYSFLITNTGNTTLTNVAVTDPLAGLSAVNCPASEVAVGGSMTCTASLDVDQARIDAGSSIVNTATVSTNETEPEQDDATVTLSRSAALTAVKSSTNSSFSVVGEVLNYEILVTNTGNVTLAGLTISDPLTPDESCPASTLAPGESMTCTATHAVTQADIDAGVVKNIATVGSEQTEEQATNEVIIEVVRGTLTITKRALGGDGTFSFTASGITDFVHDIKTSGGTGSVGPIEVNVGSVTIRESAAAGYNLTAISCDGGSASVNLANREVTVDVGASANVQCTFTNSREGSITVRKQAVGADGTFGFTSTHPSLPSFELSTKGGWGEMVATDLPAGTYEISEKQIDGWSLTSLSCSGGTAEAQLATRMAVINLQPGENIVCTFTNSETDDRTRVIIGNFMARRGDLLTSNNGRPRLIERTARTDGAGVSGGPMRLGGSGTDRAGRFQFATSLSQLRADAEARRNAKAAKLGGPGVADAVANLKNREARPGFDVWVEGTWSYFSHEDDANRESSGHFGMFRVGADYLVRPWLLFGALVQYDRMDEASDALGYEIDGHGWMIGPYAEFRLNKNLIFDVKGLWGRSYNNVSPYLTYTDNFDTTRWLAAARLTGSWVSGNWHFSPRAQLIWYEDKAESYVDSTGTFIAGQTLKFGRFIFGPEVSYRLATAYGGMWEPRVGVKGMWTFSQSAAAGLSSGSLSYQGIDDFRLRVEGGLKWQNARGARFEVEGSHEGFGTGDLEATTGKLRFTMPLSSE